MKPWMLAAFFKPLFLLLLFLGTRAVSNAMQRRMKDGKLKRLLLRRIS